MGIKGNEIEKEENLLGKATGKGPGAMLWRCGRTGGYIRGKDLESHRIFFFLICKCIELKGIKI